MRGILSTGVLANMAKWQDRRFEKLCILYSEFCKASHGLGHPPRRKIRSGSRRK
jgi:hypothetical protein